MKAMFVGNLDDRQQAMRTMRGCSICFGSYVQVVSRRCAANGSMSSNTVGGEIREAMVEEMLSR